MAMTKSENPSSRARGRARSARTTTGGRRGRSDAELKGTESASAETEVGTAAVVNQDDDPAQRSAYPPASERAMSKSKTSAAAVASSERERTPSREDAPADGELPLDEEADAEVPHLGPGPGPRSD